MAPYIDIGGDLYRQFKDDLHRDLGDKISMSDLTSVVAQLYDAIFLAGKAFESHSSSSLDESLIPPNRFFITNYGRSIVFTE